MSDERKHEISSRVRPLPTYLVQRAEEQSHEAQLLQNPLQNYARVFISYRWMICSIASFIVGLTALYSFLATPMYSAEGRLKIGTYSPLIPGATLEDSMRQQTQEQDYLQTQVEVLSSLTLADRVLSDQALDQDLKKYFSRKTGLLSIFDPLLALLKKSSKFELEQTATSTDYRFPLNTLEAYLDLIKVTPLRKTSLVRVAATTADPELSAKIVNLHCEGFIELVRAERQQSTLENLVFLKGQAEELADKVAMAERNMASYAEENAIVSLNNDENIVVKRMAELSQLLTSATAARIKSESNYNEARSGSGIRTTSLDDRSIEDLRTKLKENEAEYSMLAQKYTPSYPRMVQLRASIERMKNDLSEQRSQAVNALEARYRADLQSEEELKKQLELQKSKAYELSRRQVQYNILKREYESLKDLHQSVLRQLKESQMSAESRGSNITLSDRAAVPLTHTYPKRLLYLLFALALGPTLGLALALLLDALDNTIKTAEQLQESLHIPALGVVPSFMPEQYTVEDSNRSPSLLPGAAGEERTADAPAPALLERAGQLRRLSGDFVTITAPRSIASESFRTVRTGLLLSSADDPPRVVMITSAKKGEGKTTLAVNLAVTLAQASSRTVVVDADLRRPSVGPCFGFDQHTCGLVDYLTGQRDLASATHPAPIDNLYVIPSGPRPPNPAELVGSRKMAEMLQMLAEQYDYVLIDAPPVLPVTDAVALSRVVDGVLLVLRGQNTQRHVAREANHRLQQVNARILGAVLNDVDVRAGDHYYYYRDAYADYYLPDDELARPR